MPAAQPAMPPPSADVEDLAAKLRSGDRAALARAITLVESTKPEHRPLARALVQEILPQTGRAIRVGVTGVPGVGKSTTIDALGANLLARGRRIAVLAVDPSSTRTGGSILGDKTRMARLAADERAYVRPSPASGTLGGVAAKTREAVLLCEAAGFDVVLVETVGTGQSETAVAEMVDVFLLLALPGAGDELQGIKKGVLELADLVAVNKADGEGAVRARAAAAELRAALHILGGQAGETPVTTISGLAEEGLETLWEKVEERWTRMRADGALEAKRRKQHVAWMWTLLDERLRARLRSDPVLRGRVTAIERAVARGELAALPAAEEIAEALGL